MKTAIVTGDYYRAHETMVNRHVEHIFQGNTCIITGRFTGENPYQKPVFERRGRLSFNDILIAAPAMLTNRIRYSTSRAPFGRRKDELRGFLRDNKVEAVLAEFGTQVLAIAPLAREMDIPIFTYFSGSDASKSLTRPAMVEAYRRCIPRLNGVFAVSQFLLDNLSSYGVQTPNAHVIPSGVNVRRFVPQEKQPLSCVAVGRLIEKKAPLATIRAFAEASKHLPEARLAVIGGGSLMGPARALVKELGLGDRVSLLGAQSHEVVRQHLATSEVFLQHSVLASDGNAEGLPTAIQEAMACGCAIVSTRHAGIPEAVDDGVTGFLVAEHDEVGYTARLRDVLHDEGLRSSMGQGANRTATERFDNDVLLKKLEGLMVATVQAR